MDYIQYQPFVPSLLLAPIQPLPQGGLTPFQPPPTDRYATITDIKPAALRKSGRRRGHGL